MPMTVAETSRAAGAAEHCCHRLLGVLEKRAPLLRWCCAPDIGQSVPCERGSLDWLSARGRRRTAQAGCCKLGACKTTRVESFFAMVFWNRATSSLSVKTFDRDFASGCRKEGRPDRHWNSWPARTHETAPGSCAEGYFASHPVRHSRVGALDLGRPLRAGLGRGTFCCLPIFFCRQQTKLGVCVALAVALALN